jgi:hypothetical protein
VAAGAGVNGVFGDDFVHEDVVRADDEVFEQLRFVAEADELAVGADAVEKAVVVALAIAHAAAVAAEADAGDNDQVDLFGLKLFPGFAPTVMRWFENFPLADDQFVHALQPPEAELVGPGFVHRAVRHDDALAAGQSRGEGLAGAEFRAAVEIPEDRASSVVFGQIEEAGDGLVAEEVFIGLGVASVVGGATHLGFSVWDFRCGRGRRGSGQGAGLLGGGKV